MKSSAAKPKVLRALFGMLLLGACTSAPSTQQSISIHQGQAPVLAVHERKAAAATTAAPAVAPATPAAVPAPASPPAERSLESLEHAEFEHPNDPMIKLQLARKLWCLNRRGEAFENWLWLKRTTAQSSQGIEAIQHLEQARTQPDDLAEALNCPR